MKKILALFITTLFLISTVCAEEIVKVDMDTAINIALAKNVMYQSKKKDLEIAEKILRLLTV